MAKILFLTYHLPTPDEPGGGRPWGEATLLKSMGHEVTVLTAGTQYLTGASTRGPGRGLWVKEEKLGICIVRTYAPSGFRGSMPRRLLNYLIYSLLTFLWGLRSRPDFVFVGTDPMFLVPVGYLLARLKGARLVLDERDLFPDTLVAVGYLRPGLLLRSIEALQNFVRRRAHGIVAASPGIRRLLIQKNIPSGKIVVVPNAFPPDVEEEAGWSLPGDRNGEFVVLYAGGMGTAAYELLTILRAAEELQQEGLPIAFVFIGEGDRRKQYVEYGQKKELRNCRFLPPLPRRKMAALLARSDVCLLSYRANPFWRCSLPSKIFDYLWYAKPVVLSGEKESDAAELLKNACAGLVVPPENHVALAQALRQLQGNPALGSLMGERGCQYARQHFSREAQRARLGQPFEL